MLTSSICCSRSTSIAPPALQKRISINRTWRRSLQPAVGKHHEALFDREDSNHLSEVFLWLAIDQPLGTCREGFLAHWIHGPSTHPGHRSGCTGLWLAADLGLLLLETQPAQGAIKANHSFLAACASLKHAEACWHTPVIYLVHLPGPNHPLRRIHRSFSSLA